MTYWKTAGLKDEFKKVLREDKWQRASIIAAQVHIPPDLIGRFMAKYTGGQTEAGARSNIVAYVLHNTKGVESRKVSGRNEYRLKQTPEGES